MVRSRATNVEQYLRALPAERRREIEAVRAVVRANLPPGYIESIDYGMIGYAVPLARFPDTYNGQPLCYAGLAAQKNHNALYLMGAYMDPKLDKALRDGASKEGKKLDMGKSCLRFRRAEDLPLKAIARVVAATPVDRLIAQHEAVHGGKRKPAKSGAARRAPAKLARGAKVASAARAPARAENAARVAPRAARGAAKTAKTAKREPARGARVAGARRVTAGSGKSPTRSRGAWAAAVQRARSRRPY